MEQIQTAYQAYKIMKAVGGAGEYLVIMFVCLLVSSMLFRGSFAVVLTVFSVAMLTILWFAMGGVDAAQMKLLALGL